METERTKKEMKMRRTREETNGTHWKCVLIGNNVVIICSFKCVWLINVYSVHYLTFVSKSKVEKCSGSLAFCYKLVLLCMLLVQ
jgi:hypothetical protein